MISNNRALLNSQEKSKRKEIRDNMLIDTNIIDIEEKEKETLSKLY